jgi:CubicO group peptidase (beta-lactamase class C family)
MQDFRPEDVIYVTGDESRHAAYPFRISARDLARFGLLYLRGGKWNGRQIVPEEWVRTSTTGTQQIGANSGGYEYLWWIEVNGRHFANVDLGGGSFSARGSGGHVLLVAPAHDLVVVHRVDTDVQGPRVSYGAVGRLLALILAATSRSPAICFQGTFGC